MHEQWIRLQDKFLALADRQAVDPPWANFSGIIDRETGKGWTQCDIAAGCDRYAEEKLHNLCGEAGRLLPADAWNGSLHGLSMPSPVQNPDIGRWLLYVASVTKLGTTGPTVDLGPFVQQGQADSFTGRIGWLPAACALAIDQIAIRYEQEQLEVVADGAAVGDAKPPPKKSKRLNPGERQDSHALILGALLAHHAFDSDSENTSFVGVRELTDLINDPIKKTSGGGVSGFFKKMFGGHARYKLLCEKDRGAGLWRRLRELGDETPNEHVSLDGFIDDKAKDPSAPSESAEFKQVVREALAKNGWDPND